MSDDKPSYRTDGAVVECPECHAVFGGMVICPWCQIRLIPLADANPVAVELYQRIRELESG